MESDKTGLSLWGTALFSCACFINRRSNENECCHTRNDIQNFTDASYMYLKHGSFAMLDFLPDSLWVMYLIMFSAVLILFAITWLIYRLVQKHAAKSAETDA